MPRICVVKASASSGVRANNGTMAKPLQAGRAAQNGIASAQLAKQGLRASVAALEAPAGFFDVCAERKYREVTELLGQPFDLIDPGAVFKQYPSCSASHAAVDALLEILAEQNLSCQDIVSVTCKVTPLVHISLPYRFPATPDEARFSMPFCIAAALKDKQLLPNAFTMEYVNDPILLELMKKVRLLVADESTNLKGPEAANVVIETETKQFFSKTVQYAKGAPQNPLGEDKLAEKFRRCAERAFRSRRIDAIKEAVLNVESLTSIQDLAKLLAAED